MLFLLGLDWIGFVENLARGVWRATANFEI